LLTEFNLFEKLRFDASNHQGCHQVHLIASPYHTTVGGSKAHCLAICCTFANQVRTNIKNQGEAIVTEPVQTAYASHLTQLFVVVVA
jgi:hypothetical protein